MVRVLRPYNPNSHKYACDVAMRQSGVVRGAGRQNWAAATNLLVYWVLGVPLAVWLAFRLRLGVFGLWGGLVIICCLQARTWRSVSLVVKKEAAVKHTARHGCNKSRRVSASTAYILPPSPFFCYSACTSKGMVMLYAPHLDMAPELAACARRGPP